MWYYHMKERLISYTVHHEMSRLSPNLDFDVVMFSNSILYARFNGENRFWICPLVFQLHVLKYGYPQ